MSKTAVEPRRLEVAVRTFAAVFGGLLVANGFVAFFTPVFKAAGLARADAVTLTVLFAFIVLIGVVVWAFSAPKWRRDCSAIVALGAALFGIPFLVG